MPWIAFLEGKIMLNVLLAVISLLYFLSFILFIVVLVKLFKEEGALKGILGIICGIYPFIWGWIKHKRLEMTKIMLLWTATIILPIIAGFAAVSTGLFVTDFDRLIPGLHAPAPSRVVQKRVKKPAVAKPLKTPANKGKQVLPKPPVSTGTEEAPPAPGDREVDIAFEMKKMNNLLKVNNKRPDAYYNRAWLNAYQGNLEESLKDYSQTLKLDNNDGDTLYNRGIVLAKLGRFPDALRDFSEVIRLQPDAADALCNRGNVYFQTGKTDLALNDYNATLTINPNDADILYNRAMVYKALGDEAKATEDLKKAARMMHDKTLKNFPDLAP